MPKLQELKDAMTDAIAVASTASREASDQVKKATEHHHALIQSKTNAETLINSLTKCIRIEEEKISTEEWNYETLLLMQTVDDLGYDGLRRVPKDRLVEIREVLSAFRRGSGDVGY